MVGVSSLHGYDAIVPQGISSSGSPKSSIRCEIAFTVLVDGPEALKKPSNGAPLTRTFQPRRDILPPRLWWGRASAA